VPRLARGTVCAVTESSVRQAATLLPEPAVQGSTAESMTDGTVPLHGGFDRLDDGLPRTVRRQLSGVRPVPTYCGGNRGAPPEPLDSTPNVASVTSGAGRERNGGFRILNIGLQTFVR
jgi:hypothetical protein